MTRYSLLSSFKISKLILVLIYILWFRLFSLANPGNWESFVEGFKKFFSEFWSTLKSLLAAYFKKFFDAQNPADFIKIFVEEVTGIAIELFLLYVSLGVSATKKIAEGLERLLKNPKTTVEDWMDYFKKRKKDDNPDNNKPNVEDKRKNLKEKYSENIIDGDTQLLKKVENEIKSIDLKDKFTRFENKADELFNKKPDRKISLEEYIKKVKTLIVNKEKGKRLEELFLKLNKGIKPDKAAVTVHTKRFVDNVIKNTGRELKSGSIKNTTAFQKQFKKDVDIIFKEIDDITKYEWHCFGGISDDALEWALDYANAFKINSKIKFIIY